ncbi:cell filamentation protein [Peptoniphilus asaccharolyticus DSM 20463]|uniref:protein adenylyltransferase n=1 Tax=Peptoniphilus asaccharolyticus DSM 20463 TaxID=573058 RepID=A0A1W1UD42_PEPAS|nr:Fic family protein [Peptoniphilus asaccharolyticus]MBL7576468.1 Fic family protein [Peptoniphilus asaccharolyticus]SMB78741.1 cell filamentation protein [Peptoniphilus asaccharolyticus DSM 20463]
MQVIDEEYLSKKNAIDFWENKIYEKIEIGTTKGLQQIHKYLFEDVFDFAGEIRKLNIAKGNFRFAPVLFLEDNLKIIDKMPENNFKEILNKYVEMNVAHPFLEGNGRSTRIWLDLILKKNLSQCIDWSLIDKYNYLQAMERSPINSLELEFLLKTALTDKINDRQVYMRGIQASYEYEGLNRYNIMSISRDIKNNLER